MSLLGVKWSGTRAMRAGSKTFVNPAFSNSAMPSGAVMSLASARSTLASMMSPALTVSRPAARARIFSVIVCPIQRPFAVVAARACRRSRPCAPAALFIART